MGFVRCFYSFFIGVLAFEFKGVLRNSRSERLVVLALVLGCMSCVLLSGDRRELLLRPIFSVLIVLVAQLDEGLSVRRWLSQPQLVYLGTLSYGVYMLHSSVLWFVGRVLQTVLGTSWWGLAEEGYGGLALVLVLSMTIVLVLIVSHVCFWAIEDRFRIKRRVRVDVVSDG